MRGQAVDLRFEMVEMRQVADADRAAADLVLIGRADAAPGGADLAGARRRFAQRVEVAVKGQDQRAIVGDGEIVGVDLDPLAAQLGDLVAQRPGIEDDAVADDRQRRSEEHTSELQSLMRISYAVFCLKK